MKQRQRSKKATAIRRERLAHVENRALERYGLILGEQDQARICNLIRRGCAQFLFRQSNSRSWWSVDYNGQQITVVYGNRAGMLLTVLPADAYKETRQ